MVLFTFSWSCSLGLVVLFTIPLVSFKFSTSRAAPAGVKPQVRPLKTNTYFLFTPTSSHAGSSHSKPLAARPRRLPLAPSGSGYAAIAYGCLALDLRCLQLDALRVSPYGSCNICYLLICTPCQGNARTAADRGSGETFDWYYSEDRGPRHVRLLREACLTRGPVRALPGFSDQVCLLCFKEDALRTPAAAG